MTRPDDPSDLERRIAIAAITLVSLAFVALVLVAPPSNPTYDDAKYIGVGRSVLAGMGPYTLFGTLFLKHSPLWPVIVTAPEAWLGIDPLVVGHLLNAMSMAAILLLVGWLGFRIRPAVGALSVVALISVPYTFNIARTGGIDLPSIALTFAYLAVGFRAVERRSLKAALIAGLLFGISFLIKETILPFAPVPFLAGAIRGIPYARLARIAAATLLTAALAMSWWFAMYVAYTGRVYRADFPGWTLIPLAIAAFAAVALGLAADRVAAALDRRGWPGRASARIPDRLRRGGRPLIGWLLVAGWLVVLFVFFSRTPKLLGNSLLDPDQVVAFVRTSLGSSIRLAIVYSVGVLLLVRWRPAGAGGQAVTDTVVAALCGIPLVLLVVGVGETARHYVSELAIVVVLATAGWVTTLERVIRDRDRSALAGLAVVGALAAVGILGTGGFTSARIGRLLVLGAIGLAGVIVGGGAITWWLARRGRLVTAVLAAVIALGAVGSLGVATVRAIRTNPAAARAEVRASDRAADWVATNVPLGTPVAFSSYLSMEVSIGLPAGTDVIQLRRTLATIDPAAPLGLRTASGSPDDVVAIDAAAGKANQVNVSSKAEIERALRGHGVRYWVYSVAEEISSAQLLNALTPDAGFTEVATLRDADPARPITTHVFAVDLEKLDLPSDRTWVSPDALARLVDRLSDAGPRARAAAGALLDRIVVPGDGSLDAGLTALRTIAGR